MIDKIQHINKDNLKKINLLLLGTHGFAKALGFLITMSQTKSNRLLIITISQNGGSNLNASNICIILYVNMHQHEEYSSECQ